MMKIYHVHNDWMPPYGWFVLADDEEMAVDTVKAMVKLKEQEADDLKAVLSKVIEDDTIAQIIGVYES